jgi:hypothetical protein
LFNSKQSLKRFWLSTKTLAKIRGRWQDSQTPKWQNKVVFCAVIFVDSLYPRNGSVEKKILNFQAPNRRNQIFEACSHHGCVRPASARQSAPDRFNHKKSGNAGFRLGISLCQNKKPTVMRVDFI